MGVHTATAAPARPRASAIRLGVRAQLAGLVACSFVVRTLAALPHSTPTYFPDEYIYTAIARSIGTSGRPLVRGQSAHFPALLEPLIAAPLWLLSSTTTAYHLVQAQNALLLSLAALPAYLLARRLRLGARYSMVCATFAVAVPDLAYAGFTLADPLAYPLVLAALYAAVVALEQPAARSQLGFLALAGLATFARVQYVVLLVAFVGAAALVERRRVLRVHALPLALLAAAAAGALALGPARVLGYYTGIADLHVGLGFLRWAGADLFLLALAGGVAIVPGALVGLVGARTRADRAFAFTTAIFGAALLAEAATYASNGSERFQERYLCTLLPLLPIAFGLYLKRGRPARVPVAAGAALLLLVSARVPLSGYAQGSGFTDSPFLWAVLYVERHLGTGSGALVVAAYAAVGAALAVAVAWGRGARVAVAVSLGAAVVASVGATAFDVEGSRASRARNSPADVSWIDAHRLGAVTAVSTELARPAALLQQIYWNRSVTREVRLGDGVATDAFGAPRLRIGADGTLRAAGEELRTPILLDGHGATVVLDGARVVERARGFALWQPHAAARLRLLETGRSEDGWLARSGRLTIWPDGTGRTRGTLSFTLSLPRGRDAVTIRFAGAAYRVAPGVRIRVRHVLDERGAWSSRFSARRGVPLPDLRVVSVRSTVPRFVRTRP